jgi:hypothetical protein
LEAKQHGSREQSALYSKQNPQNGEDSEMWRTQEVKGRRKIYIIESIPPLTTIVKLKPGGAERKKSRQGKEASSVAAAHKAPTSPPPSLHYNHPNKTNQGKTER